MGAERIQDLPNDAVLLVVAECHIGGNARWHADRKDDVTHPFARRLTHHPAHCLHDVDLAIARMQEQDCVEGRHVDALGQASGHCSESGRHLHRPLP